MKHAVLILLFATSATPAIAQRESSPQPLPTGRTTSQESRSVAATDDEDASSAARPKAAVPVPMRQSSVEQALVDTDELVMEREAVRISEHLRIPESFDGSDRRLLATSILNSIRDSELEGHLLLRFHNNHYWTLIVRHSPTTYANGGQYTRRVIETIEHRKIPAERRQAELRSEAEKNQKTLELLGLKSARQRADQLRNSPGREQLRQESLLANPSDTRVEAAAEDALLATLVQRTVELKHVSPAEAARVLESVGYTEDVKVIAQPQGSSIILQGEKRHVDSCQELLQRVDGKQVRDQLLHLRVGRESVLKSFGPGHPQVRALDAQIHSMGQQLKRDSDGIALGRILNEVEADPKGTIDRIRQRYEQAERSAAKAAKELRALRSGDEPDASAVAAHEKMLRQHVRDAFSRQVELQYARLFDAEMKLRSTRQRLASRQQIADKIIDRRVKELESGE